MLATQRDQRLDLPGEMRHVRVRESAQRSRQTVTVVSTGRWAHVSDHESHDDQRHRTARICRLIP